VVADLDVHADDFARSVPRAYTTRTSSTSSVHSYRHRLRPRARRPPLRRDGGEARRSAGHLRATVVIESGSDGVGGWDVAGDRPKFTGPYRHELLPTVGHNVPQEARRRSPRPSSASSFEKDATDCRRPRS
jgi:hypothetical protein